MWRKAAAASLSVSTKVKWLYRAAPRPRGRTPPFVNDEVERVVTAVLVTYSQGLARPLLNVDFLRLGENSDCDEGSERARERALLPILDPADSAGGE